MVLTAIALLIQFLPPLLNSLGAISPNMSSLIQHLGAAVPSLVTALSSGQDVPDEVLAVLSAFKTELAALKSVVSGPSLQLATTLDDAVAAALAQYEASGKVTDPSTLAPLPTDL